MKPFSIRPKCLESLHNQTAKIVHFRNTEILHLSEQGKRALATEFEKYIDKQMAKQNPLQKALEMQQVTQLLPALERG